MKISTIQLFLFSALTLFMSGCSSVEPPAPFGACPTPQQVAWQRMEMNMFCHFGPNTFSDKEWGDGTEAAALFNPTALDCRQWVGVAAGAGFSGIILTAKHHDGFCLWPSSQTTHTVALSPWQDGKGDVLQELRQAIDDYNSQHDSHNPQLKMGVYISPWDRNHPAYGTNRYNSIFASTLAEVHQSYGPIFEQWLDGANGEGPNGKKQHYNWDLFNSLIMDLSPDAVIFSDVGPGCRWVGNENGAAGETCWSTLNTEGFTPGAGAPPLDTLSQGNRGATHWVPAETDVSIRPGWFWHPNEQPKSVDELVEIYFNSVGRNSLLLLNVPPDRRGLISQEDSLRLMEFRAALDSIFATDLTQGATIEASATRGRKSSRDTQSRCLSSSRTGTSTYHAANMLNDDYDSYWSAPDSCLSPTLTLSFKQATTFSIIMLQEYIPLGQRIARFTIEYRDADGKWRHLTDGTTIGYKRLLRVPSTTATALRINIMESMACPLLNKIGVYQ